jgi:hypothetical protein
VELPDRLGFGLTLIQDGLHRPYALESSVRVHAGRLSGLKAFPIVNQFLYNARVFVLHGPKRRFSAREKQVGGSGGSPEPLEHLG